MFAPRYLKKLATYEKIIDSIHSMNSSKVYFSKRLEKKSIFHSFSFLKILQIFEICKNGHKYISKKGGEKVLEKGNKT